MAVAPDPVPHRRLLCHPPPSYAVRATATATARPCGARTAVEPLPPKGPSAAPAHVDRAQRGPDPTAGEQHPPDADRSRWAGPGRPLPPWTPPSTCRPPRRRSGRGAPDPRAPALGPAAGSCARELLWERGRERGREERSPSRRLPCSRPSPSSSSGSGKAVKAWGRAGGGGRVAARAALLESDAGAWERCVVCLFTIWTYCWTYLATYVIKDHRMYFRTLGLRK